jgi:hypothetical protein
LENSTLYYLRKTISSSGSLQYFSNSIINRRFLTQPYYIEFGIEIGTESCRSGMESHISWNILVATDTSELAKKAVGSAIRSAKLNNAKLYAVNVIAPGEISVTQRDPRNIEWKKQVKELREAQGREATACSKTAGKIVNVTVEPVICEGNPADEFLVIKLH